MSHDQSSNIQQEEMKNQKIDQNDIQYKTMEYQEFFRDCSNCTIAWVTYQIKL